MNSRALRATRNLPMKYLNGRAIGYRRGGITVRSLQGFLRDSSENQQPRYTINRLSIDHLTRNMHDQELFCQAYNNNVTAPTTAQTKISMNRE